MKDAPVAAWKNAKAGVRRAFLSSVENFAGRECLEIGAFASPTLVKSETNVVYLDRLSTEELKRSVADPAKREAIVPVDVVQHGNAFPAELQGRFDIVVANHVVEHVPNLIGWLKQIRGLLKPAGVLVMAVPDRDYTFDKLREPTTLREALAAYFEDRQAPPVASIVDQNYFSRPITTGGQVWNDAYADLLSKKRFRTLREAIAHVESLMKPGKYVDCHCNVFTLPSFTRIVDELSAAGLIGMKLEKSKPTQRPYNEFFVALRRQADTATGP